MQLLEAILHLLGWLFGWPIHLFRRWLDRRPNRDPSQVTSVEKFGRLMLGFVLTLCVLIPLGWLALR